MARHREPDADERGGPSDNDADDRPRTKPATTGAAKATQRGREAAYDAEMHSSVPSSNNTSGMERAMGAHADKLHPVKPKRGRGY